MNIPVHQARKLRCEGMAWRDVAQELFIATGRKFTFDAIQNACYAARRRVLRLPVPQDEAPSLTCDAVILALWGLRLNTYEIAKAIGLPEAQVANRLAVMRGREAA